jgi:hypothetical protein
MRKLSGAGGRLGVISMRGLFLAVLLVSISILFLVTPSMILPVKAQCTPDFTLSGSSPTTITAGSFHGMGFVATSVCGLYGTVHYSVSITPTNTGSTGISLHQPTYHPVVLSATHPSGGVSWSVVTTPNTLITTWTITVTVSVLTVVHTVNLIVHVNGYTINASPTTVSAPLGQPVQSTITLTGAGGYNGTIYYSISISPDPPGFGSNACFNPVPGGPTLTPSMTTATSQWSCTIGPDRGTYTVTITATPLNGAPDLYTTITVKVT